VNIHFDPNLSSQTPDWHDVRCDELPRQRLGYIYRLCEGVYIYQTEVWSPYAARRNKTTRRHRRFDTLDAAKAAAVAYVTRKVKQARDEQNVRHGHGVYFKRGRRWFYIHDVEAAGQHPIATPALSKAHAKQCLQSIPSWAVPNS